MSNSRRGFAKNLRGIDTRIVSAEGVIANIGTSTTSTLENISVNSVDFTSSTDPINFNNLELNNVNIVSGNINNTSIGGTSPNTGTFTNITINQNLTMPNSTSTLTLTGASAEQLKWAAGSNLVSLSDGISLEIGNIKLQSNIIQPKTLGSTIFFTGNIDFTSATTSGITDIASPLLIDNLSLHDNILETTVNNLILQSATGSIFLLGNSIISGGTIDGTIIGNSTASTGTFTNIIADTIQSDSITLLNALSFSDDTILKIKDTSVTALTIEDNGAFPVQFLIIDTFNNQVTFPGDVTISGTLTGPSLSISGITIPGTILLNSTGSRIVIKADGAESAVSATDAVEIISTNPSGGISLLSQATSGIKIEATSGDISLSSNTVSVIGDISISSSAYVDNIDTIAASSLTIANTNATSIVIGQSGVLTNTLGSFQSDEGLISNSLDTIIIGPLSIGTTNASTIVFSGSGVTSTFQGPLQANEDVLTNRVDSIIATPLIIGNTNTTAISLGSATIEIISLGLFQANLGVETNTIDSLIPGTLSIGASTATKVEIANTGVITETLGPFQSQEGISSDNIDSLTAGTLSIGASVATKVEIADAGVITEILGSFNSVGGISTSIIDTNSPGTLSIGASAATKVEIADAGVITETLGPFQSQEGISSDNIDSLTAGTLSIGSNTATKVEIADTGVITETLGQLSVTDTTNSTSIGTGSIITSGGVGIASDIHIGGGIVISSLIGPDVAGAMRWTGSALEAYDGVIWNALYGVITHAQIDAHVPSTSNPHSVTAAQTGALALTGGTMSGAINMGGNGITNTVTPTLSSDVATKGYVDSNDITFIQTSIPDQNAVGIGSLAALTVGTDNTTLGNNTLNALTTGIENIAIGENSGGTLISGSNCIVIGSSSDVSAAGASGQIVIGHNATCTADNEFYIDGNTTQIRMNGLGTHVGGNFITMEPSSVGSNRIRKVLTLPVYADDTAAGVGGLNTGDIYRSADGIVRIKL